MLTTAFNKPLTLQITPSRTISIIIATVHLLVAIIIFFLANTLPMATHFLLIIIIVSSYLHTYRWHVAQTLKRSILEVTLNSSGDFSIITYLAKPKKVILLASSFSSQYLIILNFCSSDSRKYTVLLTNGMITEDDFRHLKVHLKTSN
jgi:uncharacterized membrane protein YgcG